MFGNVSIRRLFRNVALKQEFSVSRQEKTEFLMWDLTREIYKKAT